MRFTHSFIDTAEKSTKYDIACSEPLGFVFWRDNRLEILCKMAHVADIKRFESAEIALKVGIEFAKRNEIAMLFPAIHNFGKHETE